MKAFKLLALAGVASLALAAGEANAAAIAVDFSFSSTSPVSFTGTNLGAATSVNLGSSFLINAITPGSANNTGLATTNSPSVSLTAPISVSIGSALTKTFTTSAGTFTESLGIVEIFRISAGILSFTAQGTISGPAGFNANPVQFSATLTTTGASIASALSDTTQFVPVLVPEPATLAVLGTAVLGLGALRRRRA